MGNLSNKNLQANVCFDIFIKDLVERHNYKIISYNPSIESYELSLLNAGKSREIIKFGDMYMFYLDRSLITSGTDKDDEKANLKACLIEPFLRQICTDSNLGVANMLYELHTYDKIFVLGFDQINWCKIVGVLLLRKYDDHAKIELLCAAKPNTEDAEEYLNKYSKVDCNCSFAENEEHPECEKTKHQAIAMTKLGFGKILIYFALLSLPKKFPYVSLECDIKLSRYYNEIGFMLGKTPKYSYHFPHRKNGRFFIEDILNRTRDQFKAYLEKLQPGINKLSPEEISYLTVTKYPFVDFIQEPVAKDSLVSMIFPMENFRKREFIEDVLIKATPNILSVLYSKNIFDVYEECAMSKSKCIEQYLD